MPHIDIDYTITRETKRLGRGTGVKHSRVETDDNGVPTGKVTLRNGRGENLGSFTVTDEGTKVHKQPVKKARKGKADEAAQDDASE